MIKKIIIFIIIISLSGINLTCTCDAESYQIKSKQIQSNGKCLYRADAFTTCGFWQNRDYYQFEESCSMYNVSQILSKVQLDKYK